MSGRSILDFTIEELEEVFKTNELPEGSSLRGIDQRSDFERLYKHRMNPKYIAQVLMRERLKTRVLTESPETKNERLALRRADLELKKIRVESQTQMQGHIYKRLQAIEAGVQLLVSGSSTANGRLERIEEILNKLLELEECERNEKDILGV